MGEIQNIENEAKALFTFGKSHLVLVILLAASLLFGVYMYDSHRAAVADARAAVAEQQAKDADARANQAVAANQIAQQQFAQKEAEADQRVQQLQAEVDGLAKAIAARDVALKQQQGIDAHLPPTQLAGRWEDLIHVPNGVAVSASGYVATQDAAVATVQALESVPVLTQDIKDLNKTVTDKDSQLAQKDIIVQTLTAANTSNQATCTAQLAGKDADIKAANAERDKAKADAKKHGFWWYVAGVLTGLAIRK